MDVPAGVTQEEGNTGFSIHLLSAVLALIFLARRIQPFLSLVDREVEFCVRGMQVTKKKWTHGTFRLPVGAFSETLLSQRVEHRRNGVNPSSYRVR